MARYTSRICEYPKDRPRLVDLLLAWRAATDVRLYPTIWRVLLLLTSRLWAPEKDARLWENATGDLAGFAMLWRRQPTSPYLVLDWFAHPASLTGELLAAMLAWGDQRAQQIATVSHTPLTLYTSVIASEPNQRAEQSPDYVIATSAATKKSLGSVITSEARQSKPEILSSLDFLPLPPNPAEHNVYFARSLQGNILAPALPPGYTARRLQGIADLVAYQSIYSFAAVNPEHQKELLESDEYAHWLIANPSGELSAYCECSFWRAEWELTSLRIGWIDYIETQEKERGKGLGRLALLAGLAQLQSWEAQTAMLVTINTNIAAVRLYEKTGFKQVEVEEAARYEKLVRPVEK